MKSFGSGMVFTAKIGKSFSLYLNHNRTNILKAMIYNPYSSVKKMKRETENAIQKTIKNKKSNGPTLFTFERRS